MTAYDFIKRSRANAASSTCFLVRLSSAFDAAPYENGSSLLPSAPSLFAIPPDVRSWLVWSSSNSRFCESRNLLDDLLLLLSVFLALVWTRDGDGR